MTIKEAEDCQVEPIEIQPDIFTYAALTSKDELNCVLLALAQIVLACMYFDIFEDTSFFMPIGSVEEFLSKLLCAYLMHVMVCPDLKATVDLFSYLKNQKSYMPLLILTLKFAAGFICETMLVLSLSCI